MQCKNSIEIILLSSTFGQYYSQQMSMIGDARFMHIYTTKSTAKVSSVSV